MRQHENLARVVLVSLSVALPVVLFLSVRESLFFDRFYYQKSEAHGYWLDDTGLESFGPRSADIWELSEWMKAHPEATDQAPSSGPGIDPDRYTVALIGDSFVFGQGLRNRDRFPVLLEALLEQRAPSRVLSLAVSGDSLLDHYLKFHWLMRQGRDVDLVVVALVQNDFMLNGDGRYDPVLGAQIESACPGLPIYRDPGEAEPAIPYDVHLERAYDSERYGNRCVVEHLVSRLMPRDRTLYFDYGFTYRGFRFGEMFDLFAREGMPIVDASIHLRDPSARPYFVSERDKHPSKSANRVFARVLFDAITGDPRWGFPAPSADASQ